jgi:hypothetical protein
MGRADRGRSEEENDQQRARCVILGVIERESAQQLAAREEPGVRECKSAQLGTKGIATFGYKQTAI